MSNALKHHHPYVPFAQVGDDKITALAHLADIFKNKFQKYSAPELIQAPLEAAEKETTIRIGPANCNFPNAAQLPKKVTKTTQC
jgi:hypothetical protein